MTRWFALSLLLTACSGGSPATPAPQDKPSGQPAPKPPPEQPPVDREALEQNSDSAALVPSPVETQRALEAAGVDTQLASLVPKHDFDLKTSDLDHAAVRTGVVLADLLLTVKTADTTQLVTHLEAVKTGMTQLEGGSDIERTIDDYIASVRAESISRDELLKEFDELSGVIIPELTFNGRERVVPLIKAGSWLEGANLVARAVKAKQTPAAADGLLKQPAVVRYFKRYVTTEAEAPPQVTKTLEASLDTLLKLAEKAQPLDDADIDQVIASTGEVMGLL